MRQIVGDVPLGGSPFPPIADYALPVGLRDDARSSRRAATSSGCACRGSTRRASSARSSTATPAASASARPTQTCPAGRRYLPGTMVLETTWGTRTRLDHRPRRAADRPVAPRGRALAHAPPRARPTTTPTTCCCARCAASTARSRCNLDCEPMLRLRRARRRTWEYTGDGYHEAIATAPRAATSSCTLTTDLRLGFEGRARPRPHDAARGRHRRSSRCRGPSTRAPQTYDEAYSRLVRTADYWQEWLAHGEFPDHPWRALPAAQRADAEGPDLRADRRDGRRGDDVAARDARRRAQLGLPLLAGSATRRSCSGASTRSASTGRPTTSSTSSPTSPTATTTCRSCTGSAASASSTEHDARPPRRLRGRPAGARSATAPTTSSSTTSGARCSTRSTCTRSRATSCPRRVWPMLMPPGRGGDRALARARPRHLGGARRAEALHVVEGHVLGRLRPRRAAGAAARGPRARRRAGRPPPTRSTPTSASNGVDERGVFTQHYDTDALDASLLLMPLVRFLPRRRPADRRDRPGDRRRADRGRPGAALPRRGDRRRPRPARRARSRSARSGSCRRWPRSARRAARPRAVREAARRYASARCCSTPRRSTRAPAATSATSRRRSRTSR